MSNALGRVTYPGEYVRGDGALREIGKISAKLGKKVFIMGGKTALAKVQQQIEDCLKKPLKLLQSNGLAAKAPGPM